MMKRSHFINIGAQNAQEGARISPLIITGLSQPRTLTMTFKERGI
jgi:hypothetical protein